MEAVRAKRVLFAGLGLPVALISSFLVAHTARADPIAQDMPQVAEALSIAVAGSRQFGDEHESRQRRHVSLFSAEPARCPANVDTSRLTALLTYAARSGKPSSRCLQSSERPESPEALKELAAAIRRLLEEDALPRVPVKLDLVTGVQRLASTHSLLDALKLRPGLDGACSARGCFAPWQLVALDYFSSNRPIPGVPDASFGFGPARLITELEHAGPGLGGIVRIETLGYVVDGTGARRLERLKHPRQPLTRGKLDTAVRAAEQHILRALEKNGRFRYLVEPFSGRTDSSQFSLPRQAGTALVLCELGRHRRVKESALRALELLASYERELGNGASVLTDSEARARLGVTALPLVALTTCRERVGDRYDALIARLTRGLLEFQRSDGSFYPELDLKRGTAVGKHASLYAPGQAVLALVLVEKLAASDAVRDRVLLERVAVAAESAMDHYSGPHWRRASYDFFFLEENWHCLAARAALSAHRHDAYERFCLDYVAFKSRIVLDASDGALPEWRGGYGVSSLFPPHHAATAGFGEALAAAMAVKQVRGMPIGQDRVRMRAVLEFLTAAQWTGAECFACAAPSDVVGGFSEHAASPWIRIDYVQHAMAALGHGGQLLEL